ncbi:MAG: hypothetical protein Edafosvirus14_12 [Edafosvirus sp.]|uniref:Uncharacterized protein n=1 Tax=Edafosvirus sp. TaxID=2487765 RepID=A0A3G4ZUA2_9VIRU|nr:MAG: hypothetical protein Edafosvirus14_12 [Edafosvirus sp.]
MKSGHHYKHATFNIGILIKQIARLLNFIPKNFNIYVYLLHCDLEEVRSEVKKNYPENFHRIIIVDNFDDIKFDTIPYYVYDTCVIRALASLLNKEMDSLLMKYKNLLCTTKNTYYRAIASMNDEELKQIKLFNINIIGDEPDTCIYVSGRTLTFNYDNVFTKFSNKINYYKITSGIPKTEIKEITKKCMKCNKILFIDAFGTNECCSLCNGGEKIKIELTIQHRFKKCVGKYRIRHKHNIII